MANAKKFHLFEMRNFPPPAPPKPEAPALPPEILNTEFKKKYPPDLRLGQELDDNARVWKVYRDEAIQHDDGMLQAWNNTINILLTFSGLFSAAVTAFVIESYQFLQSGPVDLGSALHALAVNDTSAVRSVALSPGQPSSTALFINGLWFTSLFLSLAAAFLCILIKQWLDEYTTRTRASSQNARHWSRRRAFYFGGLDYWGVAGIISILPMLLHAALFLFFAGMVLLLSVLTKALAAWLSALAGTLLVLYGISLCIPLWNSACPFATPLVTQVRRFWVLSCIWLLSSGVIRSLRMRTQRYLSKTLRLVSALSRQTRGASSIVQVPVNIDVYADYPTPPLPLYYTAEDSDVDGHKARALRTQLGRSDFDQVLTLSSRGAAQSDSDLMEPDLIARLDCDALCWLVFSVSDSDASIVAFQAIGAVTPFSPLARLLRKRTLHRSTAGDYWISPGTDSRSVADSSRVIRSVLALGIADYQPMEGETFYNCFSVADHWLNLSNGAHHPDLEILSGVLCLTFAQGDLCNSNYRWLRDACMSRANERSRIVPWLHSVAINLATLEGVHRNLILLFLCLCDLTEVSHSQWAHLLPALRLDIGSCPHHARVTPNCDFGCILEAFLIRVLEDDQTVDHIVVLRLLDGLVMATDLYPTLNSTVHPRNSSTWVSYVISPAFRPRTHSRYTLRFLLQQLELPSNWSRTGPPDIGWLRLWQRIAHLIRVQGADTGVPLNLVTSMLWNTATAPPEQPSALLLTVLRNGRRPSIWTMVSPSYHWKFPRLAVALAVALCSLRRSNRVEAPTMLVDSFLASVDVPTIIEEMRIRALFPWSGEEPQTDIHLITHFLELCPSWWVRAVNGLEHDDEHKRQIRAYAIRTTTEVLRRGPCRDCLPIAPPETFGIWMHDLDDARSGFLSHYESRDAALLELEENENDEGYQPRFIYDYGTLDGWRSDDEDNDLEDTDLRP